MKLLRQQIEAKTGAGTATLLPEEPEDMWHAYNLIQPTDQIRAKAIRRISKEMGAGAVTSQRIALDLTIAVTSSDFDLASNELHVAGRVVSENEHVKMGSHHTLDLELNRKFTLEKVDGWDSVAVGMLTEACNTGSRAEMWAVVMGEGIANICLITEHQTILRNRVEVSVPRKGKGHMEQHNKGLEKFHNMLLSTLQRDMESAKRDAQTEKTAPLLLASAGFYAQAFLQFVKDYAVRTGNKFLQVLIPSIVVAHSAGEHVHNLAEVLASPACTAKLSDAKFTRETALMDTFMKHMRLEDGRAAYGPREIERAVDSGAVGRGGGVLLISNTLFRSHNLAERKRWVALVDRVKDIEGGEVRVLSSLHESGKRLEALGSIAAILTYPLEEIDDDEDEEEVNGVHANDDEMII
ncbi:Translation factor pelota [Didymosphaeria variabile]|uniref:Protein DOM34 homolog n=1 Tax=Didymosphaeria variabile TaxID=1932322 RepID=A0A9W8XKN5_9PLEO|nr:Translation factor pelota [Didymosphaeria variabile]KAJ4351981.1 Translation factor pelota [Didymosphaeria variabile]